MGSLLRPAILLELCFWIWDLGSGVEREAGKWEDWLSPDSYRQRGGWVIGCGLLAGVASAGATGIDWDEFELPRPETGDSVAGTGNHDIFYVQESATILR